MARFQWIVILICSLAAWQAAAQSPTPFAGPITELATRIAEILGPGQVRLTIRNQSTLATSEIPAIRKQLERDLKEHGVVASGSEAASTIRVTLSENQQARLWVAEIVQGNQTRVTMVEFDRPRETSQAASTAMMLRRQRIPVALNEAPGFASGAPVLAALETSSGLVVLEPQAIRIFYFGMAGYLHGASFAIDAHTALGRDPRGMLMATADGEGFNAYLPGAACEGRHHSPAETSTNPKDAWEVHCRQSDDPWPILITNIEGAPTTIKAFFNTTRNFFTGVLTPNPGVDLPPFYSATIVPRATGSVLLLGGIDGKVQLVEGSALKPVSGARDWGSEFAALDTGCGAGHPIVASASGAAASDSLRAYELPALEAVPVSAPLAMDGTVMALAPATDGKSLFAIVRTAANQYEVDRVSALCD